MFPFLALLTCFPNDATHTTTYLCKTIHQWPGASKMCSKGKLQFEFFSTYGSDRLYRYKAPSYQFEGNEKEYTAARKEQEA